jgi:hypothetical protein
MEGLLQCGTPPSEPSADFQSDPPGENAEDQLFFLSRYPHLNPSTAEMSFEPYTLDPNDSDSGDISSSQTVNEGAESLFVHEFLVCAILDFQRDMKKPETIIEPLRSVPEGSVLKPPITFLRKCNKKPSS